MPSLNVIRWLEADTGYHCYNRGVDKRIIFNDEQDYGVFLQRLKMMLDHPENVRDEFPKRQLIRSFHRDIDLLAYCLMPNHFHLLVYQYKDDVLPLFMKTLSTSYTMYFNKRYGRSGALFQGKYRASRIDSDVYNLHISRYIHLNPADLGFGYERYPYSSMRFLADPNICPGWLKVDKLLGEFGGSYEQYKSFVDSGLNQPDVVLPELYSDINIDIKP